MRDQIHLIRAKKGRLGLVLLDRVDICADFMENLFKDEVAQWLGRDYHEE